MPLSLKKSNHREATHSSSRYPENKGQSKKIPLLSWNGARHRNNGGEMCAVPTTPAMTAKRASNQSWCSRATMVEGWSGYLRAERSVLSIANGLFNKNIQRSLPDMASRKSDNVPFASYEIKSFAASWEFELTFSSPGCPQSNGLA